MSRRAETILGLLLLLALLWGFAFLADRRQESVDAACAEAYEDGYRDGYEAAREEVYQAGYSDGYEEGLRDGAKKRNG